MSDHGQIFPPRDEWDIAAYDTDDVVNGYRQYAANDPSPGANHAPGYRWGWANARKDATIECDGFEPIRRAYIHMTSKPN
ncbi:hypothetical protein G6M02_08060 [Agrobacterium rhizogenes]|nr:hypothetical protein [Rhizobium rhizogenes]